MSATVSNIYLDSFLAPLAPFLARDDVTDIWCNRPQEIWLEALGGAIERHDLPDLSRTVLERLARQIAASTAQGINREHPLLSASLRDGSRVQVIFPPATRGEIALAIRKHVTASLLLDEWQVAEHRDARAHSEEASIGGGPAMLAGLRAAVLARKNILVSGGTSSGKTTLLNALIAEIPAGERLIFIEDAPELHFAHQNAVGLIAARGALGEAAVTPEDLLIASLRMRPDRIILGEIRGAEALTFLRAINTGHPGSLSTIHANTPQGAIDQLALLALQAGSRLQWDDLVRYIRRSIDLIVQVERGDAGRRIVGILEPG